MYSFILAGSITQCVSSDNFLALIIVYLGGKEAQFLLPVFFWVLDKNVFSINGSMFGVNKLCILHLLS